MRVTESSAPLLADATVIGRLPGTVCCLPRELTCFCSFSLTFLLATLAGTSVPASVPDTGFYSVRRAVLIAYSVILPPPWFLLQVQSSWVTLTFPHLRPLRGNAGKRWPLDLTRDLSSVTLSSCCCPGLRRNLRCVLFTWEFNILSRRMSLHTLFPPLIILILNLTLLSQRLFVCNLMAICLLAFLLYKCCLISISTFITSHFPADPAATPDSF